MTIPLLAFRLIKNKSSSLSYFSLPIFWIVFEYIHLLWDFSLPWLTLGNGFCMYPKIIQWYEFTGVLGGSLWIWIVNIFLFLFLIRKRFIFLIGALLALIVPILFSLWSYNNYEEKGRGIEIVVVQPNIEPYHEKFPDGKKFIPYEQQLEILTSLAEKEISKKTSYIIFPETAIVPLVEMNKINSIKKLPPINKLLTEHPSIFLITGVNSYQVYSKNSLAPQSATLDSKYGNFYDYFNTVIQISESTETEFNHKSMLIPWLEKIPYPKVFKVIEPLLFKIGYDRSLGNKKTKHVFYNNSGIAIAPVICYESIYGEYVSCFVKKGANVIGIISNDGWWGEGAGYTQPFHYCTLRAIENRRSIARAANTGISGFIDQRGDIIKQSNPNTRIAMTEKLLLNDQITFYTQYGDFIGKATILLALLIFIIIAYKNFKSRGAL
jgi:apolipoprotein N-acyltransferase